MEYPCPVLRRLQVLDSWNISFTIMPNILLWRIEYTRWWYVRSYRYHLPIDSADLIDVVGCAYTGMYVLVLMYFTGTNFQYMARASLWSTLRLRHYLVFFILFECWCVWCTCPFMVMVPLLWTSTTLYGPVHGLFNFAYKPGVGKSTRYSMWHSCRILLILS